MSEYYHQFAFETGRQREREKGGERKGEKERMRQRGCHAVLKIKNLEFCKNDFSVK